MQELRYLKNRFGLKTLSFFDETFTIDKSRTYKLCEMIETEKLGITWYCNTRVDLVDRPELQAMYNAGCRGIAFGVESGDQRILDGVKKEFTVVEARDAIKLVKDVGIKVYCSFIIGLPGETRESIDTTIQFVREALPNGAQFNVAVPYPGTELHERLREEGKIKSTNWREYFQHHAVIIAEGLSERDLEAARKRAYWALYSSPRWILQNVRHVLNHPDDMEIASQYARKIMVNYALHGMSHAH